jgi:transposase
LVLRLLSGYDDTSESPIIRRRTRLTNDDLTTATTIDDQIEQVAKRHRVPSDTVKRIFSDLLTEPTVVDYLRTRINQDETSSVNRHSLSSFYICFIS